MKEGARGDMWSWHQTWRVSEVGSWGAVMETVRDEGEKREMKKYNIL